MLINMLNVCKSIALYYSQCESSINVFIFISFPGYIIQVFIIHIHLFSRMQHIQINEHNINAQLQEIAAIVYNIFNFHVDDDDNDDDDDDDGGDDGLLHIIYFIWLSYDIFRFASQQ